MTAALMVEALGLRLTVQLFTSWLEKIHGSVGIFRQRGEYTVEEREKSLTAADAAIDDCVNAVETRLADIVGQAVGDNPRNWFATTLQKAMELQLHLRALHDVLSKRPDDWLTEKQQKELERLGGELSDRANLLSCAALTLPGDTPNKTPESEQHAPQVKIAPRRMDKDVADSIARRLDKDEPLRFKHGNVELWAKKIRDYQIQKTGLLWSCSTDTVHATDFWGEVMEESGRGRKNRSVKTVAYSGKTEATVKGADSVMNELAAQEEQHAIDVVMRSKMTDQERAGIVQNVRDGITSPAQAILLASEVPKGRKPKTAVVRE